MQILYIIVGVLTVWVSVLTILVVLVRNFFGKLSKDIDKGNLINLLQDISDTEKKNSEEIGNIKGLIGSIEKSDKLHIQKVGFFRYNPFEEMGGEHSFSLCLLDGNDSGVIVTGLHTRDRTRVYSKEIKKGKSIVELSKEETKSLKEAIGK